MKRLGITGGIGSGKTLVCDVFSTLGIPVFNSDSVAKNIMNTSEWHTCFKFRGNFVEKTRIHFK